MDEHKTFKGFKDAKDVLDRKEYFKMADGDKFIAKVHLSSKKFFVKGLIFHIK